MAKTNKKNKVVISLSPGFTYSGDENVSINNWSKKSIVVTIEFK